MQSFLKGAVPTDRLAVVTHDRGSGDELQLGVGDWQCLALAEHSIFGGIRQLRDLKHLQATQSQHQARNASKRPTHQIPNSSNANTVESVALCWARC